MIETHKTLDKINTTELKGVGPSMANKLAKLTIHTIQDLLFHLPLRYQDRTKITKINSLQVNHDVVIEGEVITLEITMSRRRSLVCRIQDCSGITTLRFFHFSAAQKQSLKPGTQLRCFGEVRRGATGLELYHPEYKILNGASFPIEQYLTPVYPSTDGLTQQTLRKLCQQALVMLQTNPIVELLPNENETTLEHALNYLHRPPTDAPQTLLQDGIHPYQQRLAFEELLAHNLSLLSSRHQTLSHRSPIFKKDITIIQQFFNRLGFSLTNAQQRVEKEIYADLTKPSPMLRLVQGDVGSGKTVIAAIATLHAISSGYQVAIMAPTEILAEQHFTHFTQWLEPLEFKLAWLTAKVKGKKREKQLSLIREHKAHVIIGTHALFQKEVQFAALGLTIIDEQHRFGVHQRLALKEKVTPEIGHPHQLIMTATPIPRTLAMSAYANLDTSIIDELPPGRTPINTVIIDNHRRNQIIERLHQNFTEGKQAYWVCTLIEESESLEAQAAEKTYENLLEMLPNYRIGLIHGRLSANEKTSIMQKFNNHALDLLVATTVIEVGVNVPNASIMVIEDADRLGLAQLHQLRGRVGRGDIASHCVLMYQAPLSHIGKQRLNIMRTFNDGFIIAEKDLELRGPGELLGTRQTGLLQLRIADLQRDQSLLSKVNSTAKELLENNPLLINPIIQRWVNHGKQYTQV